MGQQYGVTWKGRDYDKSSWNLADNINRALSAANASLCAVCASVCCSLGYVPSLGFIHDAGTLPFIYDVADMYKEITSFGAAFQAIRQQPCDSDVGTISRTEFALSARHEITFPDPIEEIVDLLHGDMIAKKTFLVVATL